MPEITIQDRALAFRQRGEGDPPLMLIHGAGGGAHVWLEQLGPLSRNRRVIAVDLPGHGLSEAMARVSVDAYARVVLDLLCSLHLESCVLLGHSMGGAVAMSAALKAPSSVKGLVLVSTAARLPVSDLVFSAIDDGFDRFGELLAAFAYAESTPRDLVQKWTGSPLMASKEVVRADFEACNNHDLREQLSSLSVPSLVVWGEEDRLVTRRQAESLARRFSGAGLTIMPGVGHMLFQEAPDAFNAAVEAFLSSLG